MKKSISDWQKAVHDNAKVHGWYDTPRGIPEMLCLIHSEISEALEAFRVQNMDNFSEECADTAIRLLDMCEFLDINLEEEIERKHNINKQRPYRHGGKIC